MQVADNSKNDSISVIIPTYNRLHTLPRAVNSVLEQTCQILEIIVIDDGSDDGTAEWLKQAHGSIRVVHQKNHGVSYARNRGIETSKGNWLAFLDSDDYWHPDKLQKQMQALASHTDTLFCHCDEIWMRNGKHLNQKHKHRKQGGYIFEHCLPLCAISPSASVIHRSVFSTYGLFNESLPACEDYDLWLRITAHEPVAFIDEPLLIKTGGHDDQLSRRYPHMDLFRLISLAELLRSAQLNAEQNNLATQMFQCKYSIVINGAKKHGNKKLLQDLPGLYSDIVKNRQKPYH